MNTTLSHFHISFILPGAVTRILFEKGFSREDMTAGAAAIEHSFNTNPEFCPDYGTEMIEAAVFSYNANREWRKLWKTHMLYQGYFMKRGP